VDNTAKVAASSGNPHFYLNLSVLQNALNKTTIQSSRKQIYQTFGQRKASVS
jgi:hypothetical protein